MNIITAATPVSSTQINLAWIDHATDETQFRIERSIGAGTFGLLATKGANATSHVDATATAGTSYKYRVLAENANGQSAWSNEAAATTPGEVPLNFDFNNLPIAASSGDARASPTFTGATGGNFLRYQSNQLGDFITFNVNVPVARQYHIAVRYHMNFQRGITQLLVDGDPVGAALNLYSPTGMLQTFTLGSRILSAGVHQFRFEVVGNWQTTAGTPTWEIGLDLLTLTPGDSTPPVLTLPEDLVLEATSSAGAVATFSATAHDNVDGAVPVALSHASGSTFPLGTTVVSAVASDSAGNTAAGSFNVMVVDTTAPALTLPGDLELEATSGAGAAATFAVSAVDSVDANAIIILSHASGAIFPLGTTTVNATATDASGNTEAGSFTVTVTDRIAPIIQRLTASPNVLWPVNQQLIAVQLDALVADLADPAPWTEIISVVCNEPVNGGGPNRPVDWEITGLPR